MTTSDGDIYKLEGVSIIANQPWQIATADWNIINIGSAELVYTDRVQTLEKDDYSAHFAQSARNVTIYFSLSRRMIYVSTNGHMPDEWIGSSYPLVHLVCSNVKQDGLTPHTGGFQFLTNDGENYELKSMTFEADNSFYISADGVSYTAPTKKIETDRNVVMLPVYGTLIRNTIDPCEDVALIYNITDNTLYIDSYGRGIKQPDPWERADYKTIDVTTPGSLEALMWELNADDVAVTVKGTLNGDDLRYIAAKGSVISAIKYLDLSGVTIDAEGENYASISNNRFVYSHDDKITTEVQGAGWLGSPGSTVYVHHNDGLGGLFTDLTNLEYVKLPSWLTNVGPYAFNGCSKLEKVDVGDQISAIKLKAFSGTALTDFDMPEGVRTIDDGAFTGTKLTNVNLANVDSIGESAFEGSTLRTVDLSHVRAIGNRAFYGTPLRSVDLSSVKYLGNNVFFESKKLKSAILARDLEVIPAGLFCSCISLAEITLPDNVRTIGSNAFKDTPWLTAHGVTEGGIVYIDNIAYSLNPKEISSVIRFREGTTGITASLCQYSIYNTYPSRIDVVFPESLKRIEDKAFYGMEPLTKVTWGDGIEYIGDEAFSQCRNMGFSKLPANLAHIGTQAFWQCNNLAFSNFPEHLKYIGEKAFQGCDKFALTELVLPEDLEFIGWDAFIDIHAINKITLNSTGLLTADGSFYGCNGLHSLVVGDKVRVIPEDLLSNCPNLKEVTFLPRQEHVGLRIETRSFGSSRNRIAITDLPSDVTYIGSSVFKNADFDNPIDLSRIEYIGHQAFYNVTGVGSNIVLPFCLETLGDMAFYLCDEIEQLHFNAKSVSLPNESHPFNYSMLKEVTIGSDVERLPYRLFYYCERIESLSFEPRDETAYTELIIDSELFGNHSYPTNLKEIVFPIGTLSVGADCFGPSLERIDLPSSFQSFTPLNDPSRFELPLTNLREIVCRAATPPTGFGYLRFPESATYGARSSSLLTGVTVYVPAESVEAYEADINGWGRCRIVGMDSAIGDIAADAQTALTDEVTAIHNLQGMSLPLRPLTDLAPGIYLVTYRSGKTLKLSR